MVEAVETALAVLKTDVAYIKTAVIKIEQMVEAKYVTKAEFVPVRNIVYGLVGTVLTTFLIGILMLVLK